MEETYRTRRVWYYGSVIDIPIGRYSQLQSVMFLEIWREREHKCAISDVNIFEPRKFNFHHILEKRNFELYSLCKWNIILLDKDAHDKYELKPDTQPALMLLKTELLLKLESNGKEYEFDNDCLWRRQDRGDLPAIFNGRVVTQDH